MPTPAQLRTIHTGARAVGLNDQQYRMLLFNVAGAASATALDNSGLEDVMAVLEGMGFNKHPGGETYWQGKVQRRGTACGERMARKIRELAPQQRYELPALCLRFSEHRTDVVERLLPREAWGLIEMLKTAVERE